ncbi:MAG: universal stress protein [Gammaproteobacteria bacterium]
MVATDFSDDASHAARRAAQLATQLSARLTLLHVMSGPTLRALREIFPNPDDAETKLIADAQRMLDELSSSLGSASLGQIDKTLLTTQVKIGKVLDEILLTCAQHDLLVLGAHGLNPLRDMLLGTTAARLLRKSMRPVLVAKQSPKGPYQRVIVPVNFSPHSVQALKTAMNIAPSADITIIHAFDVPFEGKLWIAGVADEEIHRYRMLALQQALSKIDDLVGGLDAAPYRFRHVVAHGDAPRIILDQEQELEADLIVIGKHGQSMVEDLFLGSVTRHVLADSKCDVLVVHERPSATIAPR